MPNLIAICGPKNSGKSTIAADLCSKHGYSLVRFADPLKAMLISLLSHQGCTNPYSFLENPYRKEQPCIYLNGLTPRHAMQTLGTEWGRNSMEENFWAEMGRNNIRRLLATGSHVVVDDLRFLNEEKVVREFDHSIIVRLYRDKAMVITQNPDLHPSELENYQICHDLTITNNSSIREMLENFYRALDEGS